MLAWKDVGSMQKDKANRGKAVAMARTRGATRRALSDVANLITNTVQHAHPHPHQHQRNLAESKQVLADRPLTRRYKAKLDSKLEAGKAATVPLRSNEEQGKKLWDPKPKQVPLDGLEVVGDHDQTKASMSGLHIVVLNRKSREQKAFTALLTASSEAASRDMMFNIDAEDIGDQLAVPDYVEDIYSFYRKAEVQSCVVPNYMINQPDINENMRAILIDWLIEVHQTFNLLPETLFLTVNVIDRFLAVQSIPRIHLQLAGVTAVLISSKYEEIWALEIEELVNISDNAFERQDVIIMEKLMLNKLRFNLTVPTPYVFAIRFLKAASAGKKLEFMAFFFLELCLVEYAALKFPPSLLAAAALYTAKLTLREIPYWGQKLQFHSGYSEHRLKACANLMVSLHRTTRESCHTFVFEKYASCTNMAVAKNMPAF